MIPSINKTLAKSVEKHGALAVKFNTKYRKKHKFIKIILFS